MAYAIDGRAELIGVNEGGMAGELKHGPDISRLEAGWRRWPGVAGIYGGAGGGRES
jgi:hypothetical protein